MRPLRIKLRKGTARLLGINRNTLHRKLAQYNML